MKQPNEVPEGAMYWHAGSKYSQPGWWKLDSQGWSFMHASGNTGWRQSNPPWPKQMERVMKRELNPVTSGMTNSQAREIARETGRCSDGSCCRDGEPCEQCPNHPVDATDMVKHSKYHHEIASGVWVDVYDVIKAWGATNPAQQHLIKKALQAGARGHKGYAEDMDDIIASAKRAKELDAPNR